MLETIKAIVKILGIIMFTVWNGLAALVIVFVFIPHVLIPIITETFTGEIPLSLSICIFILLFIPFISIFVAFKRPAHMTAFFYGFEMPIIVLTLLRVFLVRQLTFASAFLVGTGLIAVCIYGWYFWRMTDPKKTNRPSKHPALQAALQAALSSLVLITGIFVALLSLLYAIPLAISFIREFFSFNWASDIFGEPLIAMMIVLFVCSWIAICLFPFYMAYYYPKMWKDVGKKLSGILPQKSFLAISAVTVFVWIGAHGLLSLQPNTAYLASLNKMTLGEQAAEMQSPEKVRSRLLKAYLNEYKYIGRAGDSTNLKNLYTSYSNHREYSQFGDHTSHNFYRDGMGGAAQSIQNYLLSPLLYKGKYNDGATAGKLYSELFDISIQRAETKAISKALEATYDRDEVTAGLMNIGARNVLLLEQNINFEDKGDYAVIEIEEAYENLTFDPQEIFYYFALPEDAAITGLWVGRTPERDKMDAFIVAPRGAAQKVYEQQVRRRIDPALLEQVGPRQYRLRVFPIPVTKFRAGRQQQRDLNPMRMHMRYVVPLGPDGFALPELLEKRNVNWSRKTKHSINGNPVKVKNAWTPSLPNAQKRFGKGWHLDAEFKGWEASSTFDYSTKGIREDVSDGDDITPAYAVLVDTSYSMNKQAAALESALSDLEKWSQKEGLSLDYFTAENGDLITNEDTLPLKAFPMENFVGFGTVTPQTMLQNYQTHKDNRQYEGIIILTDQGRYAQKAGKSFNRSIPTDTPIWFAHLGQAAFAYDDEVLDAIYRSGGGVAQNLPNLLNRLYYQRGGQRAYTSRVWITVKDDRRVETTPKDKNIAALAARQEILAAANGTPPSPENLDALHDIAKRYGIITPYSSMIVLVNERQKEALKKASEADDRFDREGRSGEEALTSPSNIMVSGVQEPHEWLLILMSLLMLIVLWRKREDWRKRL